MSEDNIQPPTSRYPAPSPVSNADSLIPSPCPVAFLSQYSPAASASPSFSKIHERTNPSSASHLQPSSSQPWIPSNPLRNEVSQPRRYLERAWYKGPQVDVRKLAAQSSMLSDLELALKEFPEAGLKTCSCAAVALRTLLHTPWYFIQNQAARERPSTAFEGTKVTPAARRCPPISHSQAPSPANPRPPTNTNDYRKYESIFVGRIHRAPACMNCPCCQQNLPPKKARLLSLKSGEGETRSSPVVKAPSCPPSPLRNELHSS